MLAYILIAKVVIASGDIQGSLDASSHLYNMVYLSIAALVNQSINSSIALP